MDALAAVEPRSLRPAAVTEALRRIARLDGRLDGIQARLVAAAEAAGVPERSGAASTTSWLAQQTGRATGQAARTDRLARTTGTNPAIAEAVAAGRVGPDQAARLASGLDRGTMDPADADQLLRTAAAMPPAMFNRESRRIEARRHQRRLREREQAARDARSVRMWRDDDDALHLEARHAPADGDVVQKALNAFVRPDGKDVPDELRRTHAQLLADAMVDMCRTVLDKGLAGDVGGVRPHITVTTTAAAMAALEDAEAAGAVAVSDLGTTLSAAAFQRLACDATFRRLVVDPDGQPLDVGRATRKWSSSQRAAIVAADGGCRGPGCDLPPDRTEVHHVTWWRNGGATSTDNGVLVCNHDHALVHDAGWTLAMDPATRVCTWTAPDGTVHTTRPYGLAAPGLATDLPQRPRATTDEDAASAPGTDATRRPRGRHDPHAPGERRQVRTSDPPVGDRPGSDPPARDRPGHDPPALVPLALDV